MKFLPKKQHLLQLLPDRLVITHGPRRGNAIYLSFDDGPHPEHTPRLLDLLARHGARASFFLVGKRVERHPQLVQRIVDEGHMLGNHSFTHPLFDRLSLKQQLDEVDRTDQALACFDGRAWHSFRPPRGCMPPALLFNFARRRRGMAYWSYDSLDYRQLPPADIAGGMRARPPVDGDIVLMHDDSSCAADTLEMLLPEWIGNGRECHALPGGAA